MMSLSDFLSLRPSVLLSLHQEQNAYTTLETQRGEESLWGEKLQGEFGER